MKYYLREPDFGSDCFFPILMCGFLQEVRQQNARDAAGQAQDGLGDGQGQDGRGDGQPQRRQPEAPSPSSSFEGPMDKCLSSALGYSSKPPRKSKVRRGARRLFSAFRRHYFFLI